MMTDKNVMIAPLKIMIVDDHRMFISGLQSLLKNFREVTVVATHTRAAEALEALKGIDIDLVITDISMPGINGIEFMRKIKTFNKNIKTLVLTMHAEPAIVKSVIKENPDAFLLKNTDTEELQKAIENIAAGKRFYAREIQDILIEDLQGNKDDAQISIVPNLSAREKEVLKLIAEECTTQEIADKIFLSTNTVETYRQNLLRKLEAKNSAGLVAKAFQLGLL